MQSLKMKSDQLDEYIAEHETLIAELDWDGDSEMSCHSFWEGLPSPLAKQIIQLEGIPESLTQWVKYAQKYHSRWVMSKALGYMGKKKEPEKFKPQWNTHEKKKECDPDAMDVDFSQMTKEKKERLMKSGSCFMLRLAPSRDLCWLSFVVRMVLTKGDGNLACIVPSDDIRWPIGSRIWWFTSKGRLVQRDWLQDKVELKFEP